MDLQKANEAAAHAHECGAPVIPFTVTPALPELFTPQIENMLHLVSHILKDGEELSQMFFVVLDKDGNAHLLDGAGAPTKMHLSMFVSRYAHMHDGVAVLTMAESWTVPQAVAKEWAEVEGARPEGMQIKDHPQAYEAIMLQIETLNGTWLGSMQIDPYVEGQSTPRAFKGPLELQKMTYSGGIMSDLLMQNKLNSLPDELRGPLERILALVDKQPKQPEQSEQANETAPEAPTEGKSSIY